MNNINPFEYESIDELENECWETRELMSALEYSKWEHFAKCCFICYYSKRMKRYFK